MTMIEMVARAICEADCGRVTEDELARCTELARAALEAMCEPTHEIIKAMAESRARDDEGEFPPVCDLIDYSGENKRYTVLKQAWRDGIGAALLTPGKQ
jgi:glycerol kinase